MTTEAKTSVLDTPNDLAAVDAALAQIDADPTGIDVYVWRMIPKRRVVKTYKGEEFSLERLSTELRGGDYVVQLRRGGQWDVSFPWSVEEPPPSPTPLTTAAAPAKAAATDDMPAWARMMLEESRARATAAENRHHELTIKMLEGRQAAPASDVPWPMILEMVRGPKASPVGELIEGLKSLKELAPEDDGGGAAAPTSAPSPSIVHEIVEGLKAVAALQANAQGQQRGTVQRAPALPSSQPENTTVSARRGDDVPAPADAGSTVANKSSPAIATPASVSPPDAGSGAESLTVQQRAFQALIACASLDTSAEATAVMLADIFDRADADLSDDATGGAWETYLGSDVEALVKVTDSVPGLAGRGPWIREIDAELRNLATSENPDDAPAVAGTIKPPDKESNP